MLSIIPLFLLEVCYLVPLFVTAPGRVTIVYAGTGRPILWGTFFEQKMNFRVSFLVKAQVVLHFGVSFSKNSRVLILIKFHLLG